MTKNILPILKSSVLLVIVLLIISLIYSPSKVKIKASSQISPKPSLLKNLNLLPTKIQEIKTGFLSPKLLSIPKINLTANIIAVGLDNERRMDVPNNFTDVGWYDLGYKPGEQGSAVLDGHYDDFNSHPAVFYNLDHLATGDQIIVTDQNGKNYTYVVTDNIVYPYDQMPLQQIFTANDKARLNIITCHGVWYSSIQTYNQRTVIYSELKV